MKRTVTRTILVIVFASIFIVGAVPNAQARHDHECSNASLQGNYGFIGSGTVRIPNGVPVAQVGIDIFDGQGEFSREDTISVNGEISDRVRRGTYTINPDCRGSYTIGETVQGDLVLAAGGAEVFMINTVTGNVATSIDKKQSSGDDKKHEENEE